MTKRTRRRFSPEYKEQAVARLLAPRATQASVAAELGVTPTQLKTARAGGGGLGLGDRASAGRGRRTGTAASGQQTSERGGGGFAQGLGFFRAVGGEDMSAKLAFRIGSPPGTSTSFPSSTANHRNSPGQRRIW